MKDLLPVGSVVLLDGGDKRVMIYGIMQPNPLDNKQYDYLACLYPEGYIGPKYTYLFDHENIKEVEFLGYVDDEQREFRYKLGELLEENNERG